MKEYYITNYRIQKKQYLLFWLFWLHCYEIDQSNINQYNQYKLIIFHDNVYSICSRKMIIKKIIFSLNQKILFYDMCSPLPVLISICLNFYKIIWKIYFNIFIQWQLRKCFDKFILLHFLYFYNWKYKLLEKWYKIINDNSKYFNNLAIVSHRTFILYKNQKKFISIYY